MDLPGHGESPPMRGPMNAGEWALSVRDSVRELLEEPVLDLAIGHSAGAATLLELVALEPALVRRVVLEDPPGAGDTSRPDWAAQLEREVAAALRNPQRIERLMLHQNPTWQPRDAAEAVAAQSASQIEVIAEMERLGMGYRVVELLPTVEAPSLLLLAEEVRSALSGDARQAALASLSDSMRPRFFSTGHVIHRDAFDDYLRTILGWLARSPSAPSPA